MTTVNSCPLKAEPHIHIGGPNGECEFSDRQLFGDEEENY